MGTGRHKGRWAWEYGDIGTQGHRGQRDMRTWGQGTWGHGERGPESSAERQQAAARAEDGERQKSRKKSSA